MEISGVAVGEVVVVSLVAENAEVQESTLGRIEAVEGVVLVVLEEEAVVGVAL